MDSDRPGELLPFAALVVAFALWTILVVVYFPRLLGRLLAFVANRTGRGSFYTSIPTLHIYPLAGRIVAHSVRFTSADLTVSVEEFVLQCRWWRHHTKLPQDQVLSTDTTDNLSPTALAQQKIDRENSARFLKRIWYRCRRWWQHAAVSKDTNNPNEPNPLISLIFVGLRVRSVNNVRNYTHVNDLLDRAARMSTASTASSHQDRRVPTPRRTESDQRREADDIPNPSSSPTNPTYVQPNSDSATSFVISDNSSSSDPSIDGRTFTQRLFELTSIRINDGAFYFCDMGESPLVRLTVNTAKIRYRYGVPDCDIDICRKSITITISTIKLSVASHEGVKSIVQSARSSPTTRGTTLQSQAEQSPSQVNVDGTIASSLPPNDKTERALRRIFQRGYRGLSDPFWEADSASNHHDTVPSTGRSFRVNIIRKFPSIPTPNLRSEKRESRRNQTLACVDLISSSTAAIEYVFDEPGPTPESIRRKVSNIPSEPGVHIPSPQLSNDGLPSLSPPKCSLAIHLNGAQVTYDAGAFANLQRVQERFQPMLYDYITLAEELQSNGDLRIVEGMHVHVVATPKSDDMNGSINPDDNTLLRIPFTPQPETWIGLSTSKIRDWNAKANETTLFSNRYNHNFERTFPSVSIPIIQTQPGAEDRESESALPASHLNVNCSSLSVQLDIPFLSGVAQKLTLSFSEPKCSSQGIVDMPLLKSKQVILNRKTNRPMVWNEEHIIDTDVELFDSELLYVPDFMRIIGDVSTSMQKQSQVPPSVSHFVPYKETISIYAKDKYCINLSCARDNSWGDVAAGVGDDYGKLRLRGNQGKLELRPTSSPQYNASASSMMWTLSLPDAQASLEFLLACIPEASHDTNAFSSKSADNSRSGGGHYRVRPPSISLPRRARTQTDQTVEQEFQSVPAEEAHPSSVDIEIIQFIGAFDLQGKVLSNQKPRYFTATVPSFLDAVNINDINFHANSIIFDLNPSHITHILNLIRNYGGAGTHTISTSERTTLEELRSGIAEQISSQRRYPDWKECLILGLSQGYSLPEHLTRPGKDDLFRMNFEIGSGLIRLHELPHPTCPFDFSSKKICSVVFDRLLGKITGNRLGSELMIAPSTARTVSLYGGFLSSSSDLSNSQFGVSFGRMTPKLSFEGLKIQKKSMGTERWSSYSSLMTISIEKVFGCLMDTSMASLIRMGPAFVPDGVSESITSVYSLLSVDSIEVMINSFDVLILSPSSFVSAKDGVDGDSLGTERKDFRHRRATLAVPKFLAGVTQFRMLNGFRIISSSFAFDIEGSLSRIFLPSIAIDVLVPSGGKLSPWVDEATLLAQVAHATIPRRNTSQELQADTGVMCRAFEVRGMTIELVFSSRSSYWTPAVPSLQTQHVMKQHQSVRSGNPGWCSRDDFKLAGKPEERLNVQQELEKEWWEFLQHSNIAEIIQRHRRGQKVSRQRADVLSVILPMETVMFVSPEILELLSEITLRAKEFASRFDLVNQNLPSGNAVHFDQFTTSRESLRINPDTLSNDLLALWTEFEKNKQPNWVVKHDRISSGSSFKAFETQGVTVLLHSPKLMLNARERDSFTIQRFSDDQIFISIPPGIKVFKQLRFDAGNRSLGNTSADNSQLNRPSLIRTNVVYGNLAEVNLGCNDVPLIKIKKILLINRERNGLNCLETPGDWKSFFQRDRTTIVGKIGSVHIGQAPADFNSYSTFGRIASVFLLMLRTVSAEMESLSETTRSRYSKLCQTIMSCPCEEILQKDPNLARSYFIEALKFSHQNKNETTLGEGFSPSILTIPNVSNIPKRAHISIQTVVHSIDVTVQNMSLRIDDQEIAQSDIFSCKGGKTASSASEQSPGAELDGYVLNASFGNISLTIRDDIASRTLRMVGNVASYIQKASFSLPLIRLDGRREARRRRFGDSFQPTSDKTVHLSPSSQIGSTITLRPRRASEMQRSSPFNARRALRRPRTTSGTFQDSRHRRSFNFRQLNYGFNEDGDRPISPNQSTPDRHAPQPFDPSNNEIHSGSPGFSITPSPLASRQSPVQGRSFSPIQSPSEPNGNEGEEGTVSGYRTVAVRTAGDYGPAYKRSRRLVPVNPVVPPAFSDTVDGTDLSNESRNFTEQLHSRTSSENRRDSFFENRTDGSSFTTPQPLAVNDEGQDANQVTKKTKKPNITLFVSCREIVSRYYRSRDFLSEELDEEDSGNITFLVHEPRLTAMSHPEIGRYSLLFTASSAKLSARNNVHCVLTSSIAQISGTISLSSYQNTSSLPKLLTSCRVSEFKGTLLATDLRSVQKFRDDFKTDLKGVLVPFLKTKHAASEMAKTTRLFTSKGADPTSFSTMSFDLIFQQSEIKLEGFHPNDVNMSISYVLDGIFFSVVASEEDNAALTLGLRLHGHGLLLSSPSWLSNEYFEFPSFDARGVQWGESIGLPTSLKVTTEPLSCLTSFQGLRHVLFTITGLLAFHNRGANDPQTMNSSLSLPQLPVLSTEATEGTGFNLHESQTTSGATPFQRSVTAWERTKGVRMDISIRPIALSLASGQVVALFNLDTVTGVVEWNKLAVSDVQLQTSVTAAKVALSFMRMPTADFRPADVRIDDKRSSLSVVIEKYRIDLLKKQNDLTHTFIFRTNVSAVTGQVRPWRLLLDAAVWKDEQEFVSDLQSINYNALSTSRQRPTRSVSMHDTNTPGEHRLILFGANIQRVVLAVPLVNSEQYSTSRLAIRATDLHFLARHRFDNMTKPTQHIFEVKSHFIGILWENMSLLSSHHAQVTIGTKKTTPTSSSHFGDWNIVMVPGTWRICPRKDVVLAILEAKNRKDNEIGAGSIPMFGGITPDVNIDKNVRNEDSVSNATEKESRLLVERLNLKLLRTSGFIEGLENESDTSNEILQNIPLQRGRRDVTAKVSIPAFSVSMVRNPNHDFDLIDVDFSGREGEFPRGCIQRVANLFSELFGAVALDQEKSQRQTGGSPAATLGQRAQSPQQQLQQQREVSRNISILVRFGGSLYRAQEEAKLSFESQFGFFASPYSALLASVTTNAIGFDGGGHTNVISGVSPRLVLEIKPLLEGAEQQTLRLVDVRFTHGLCSGHQPFSTVHINQVAALIEAKTLMLINSHRQQNKESMVPNNTFDLSKRSTSPRSSVRTGNDAGRNLIFVLGKPTTRHRSNETSNETAGGTTAGASSSSGNTSTATGGGKSISDADVRLQLKLVTKGPSENAKNQAGLAIERLQLGLTSGHGQQGDSDGRKTMLTESFHCAVHNVILHGQWDILMWNVRLREYLFCFDRSEGTGTNALAIGQSSVANIINRLYVEYLQYNKRTLKLDVDALAARWEVPSRHVDIESTKVHTEVSHTLIKANAKLASQWKKLRNEVKLLSERDPGRKAKQNLSKLTKSAAAIAMGSNSDERLHPGAASSSTDPRNHTLVMSSTLPSSSHFQHESKHAQQPNRLNDDVDEMDLLSPLSETFPAVSRHGMRVDQVLTPLSSAAIEQMQSGARSSLSQSLVHDVGELLLARSQVTPPSAAIAERLKINIKGNELVVKMRGYQFDETRHSAMISVYSYNVNHVRDLDAVKDAAVGSSSRHLPNLSANHVEVRKLDMDFKEMGISYNDDERRIRSELFKVPNPKLRLSIVDRPTTTATTVARPFPSSSASAVPVVAEVDVSLTGDLEVKLGYGFYNWQEFRELFELTIRGIAPARATTVATDDSKEASGGANNDGTGTTSGGGIAVGAAGTSSSGGDSSINNKKNGANANNNDNNNVVGTDTNKSNLGGGGVGDSDGGRGGEQQQQLWDGKRAVKIHVKLNPRIDVIGDLTADVLTMLSARLNKHVDSIPKNMFDYIVIPLEAFSKFLCDPLLR